MARMTPLGDAAATAAALGFSIYAVFVSLLVDGPPQGPAVGLLLHAAAAGAAMHLLTEAGRGGAALAQALAALIWLAGLPVIVFGYAPGSLDPWTLAPKAIVLVYPAAFLAGLRTLAAGGAAGRRWRRVFRGCAWTYAAASLLIFAILVRVDEAAPALLLAVVAVFLLPAPGWVIYRLLTTPGPGRAAPDRATG